MHWLTFISLESRQGHTLYGLRSDGAMFARTPEVRTGSRTGPVETPAGWRRANDLESPTGAWVNQQELVDDALRLGLVQGFAARKQDALDVAADDMRARVGDDRVFARACHTGDTEQIGALVDWTTRELGLPTILVNNAATNPYFGPLLGVEWGAWDKTFDVNVKGTFEATRQVAERLLAAGSEGSIINVASIYGLKGGPLQGVYAMTKAAIVSMTETLAVELGHARIRVNAICPGLVETKFASVLVGTPELSDRYRQRAALGRWGQPEEIAGLATYLASDESRYVTGQRLVIDGGYLVGE